jgi:hypothetical protein
LALEYSDRNASGTKFQNTTYGFDQVGHVLSYNNAALNVKQTYQYDDLYQLTRAEGTCPVQNNSQTSHYIQTFDYDPLGNITKKTSNVLVNNNPVQDPTYKFTYHYEGTKPLTPNQNGNNTPVVNTMKSLQENREGLTRFHEVHVQS